MVVRLTGEQLQLARRLRAGGMNLRDIAKSVGCTATNVMFVTRGAERPGRLDNWTPRTGRLTIDEREEILLGLNRGESMRAIATKLNRAPSTISREVKANGEPKVPAVSDMPAACNAALPDTAAESEVNAASTVDAPEPALRVRSTGELRLPP